jgi:hypothetical protein
MHRLYLSSFVLAVSLLRLMRGYRADRKDDAREVAVEFGRVHQLSDTYINQIEQFILAHIS